MRDKFFSRRNLQFLLYDVHKVEELTGLDYYADHDRGTFDLVLDTAERLGRELFLPCLTEMDKREPLYDKGSVRVHPIVREVMRQGGEGGWIGADFPYEHGGQQLPFSISSSVNFVLAAANYSASVYGFLTAAAARLITSFASRELIDAYVEPMLQGKWQGTMGLTEPQAGSSLADIKTKAVPAGNGNYLICGQKIFISGGEHDGVDNVVNLVLARIEGAPPGVRGISLFVVPKLRRTTGGSLEPNDVTCMAIYHKMGYKGCPITQLSFGEEGDCRGFLVGEPNQGLSYMFQMMNEARLSVGMGAASIASAAYYNSLEYAMERPQGRPSGAKDPNSPQVPIVEHPDVRRMLLLQRSVVEGSLSLLLYCAKLSDTAHAGEGETKRNAAMLLDLLVPVAKSYPSEMGILSTSQAIQILGGYGYCDEFPVEQLFRDIRIHPIHEGATGIQGIDLLGRKVRLYEGKGYALFLAAVRAATDSAHEDEELAPYAERLEAAVGALDEVTRKLYAEHGAEPAVLLADATLYLELFSLVAIGWQWLVQGIALRQKLGGDLAPSEQTFYEGKWETMRYFFHYELPKHVGLFERLAEADGLTVRIEARHFED